MQWQAASQFSTYMHELTLRRTLLAVLWSTSRETGCRMSAFEKTSSHAFWGNCSFSVCRISHWSSNFVPQSPANLRPSQIRHVGCLDYVLLLDINRINKLWLGHIAWHESTNKEFRLLGGCTAKICKADCRSNSDMYIRLSAVSSHSLWRLWWQDEQDMSTSSE